MNSVVSVIIPVYNAARTIERCMLSILAQSYNHIEIIVIDDGSRDGTDSILKDICNNQDIIYIKQENQGVSVARNLGISVSSGQYVMFVDADDWIEKDCVEKMVIALQTTNSDYCFSDWYVERVSGTNVDYVNEGFAPFFSADILYRFYILNRYGCAPWGKLYKRELITKNNILFREGLPYAEDYLFILNYLSVANTCVYVKEPLLHYDCCQPGAGAKVRKNYFELQIEIENCKEQIVTKSTKYKALDEELLRISKFKYYVSALVYLQMLYTDFKGCYNMANKIIKVLNEDRYVELIRKSNFKKIDKIYAFLGVAKSAFGISVLTMAITVVKKLVRR